MILTQQIPYQMSQPARLGLVVLACVVLPLSAQLLLAEDQEQGKPPSISEKHEIRAEPVVMPSPGEKGVKVIPKKLERMDRLEAELEALAQRMTQLEQLLREQLSAMEAQSKGKAAEDLPEVEEYGALKMLLKQAGFLGEVEVRRKAEEEPKVTGILQQQPRIIIDRRFGDHVTWRIRLPNMRLTSGARLTIEFEDIPKPRKPHIVGIRGDGNITVPYIGLIKAVGKTVKELEEELHSLYVPEYFPKLTVNVLSNWWLTFSGQVKKPGMIPYLGEMTLLEAIASAGGFTDFAKKENVQVTRVNGEIIRVNCIKAQKDPALDLLVYPSDIIEVPRR